MPPPPNDLTYQSEIVVVPDCTNQPSLLPGRRATNNFHYIYGVFLMLLSEKKRYNAPTVLFRC